MASLEMHHLLAMKRLIDAVPLTPVFATWDEFPTSHAIRFQHDGRDFVGAHPDLWKKIPASDRGTSPNQLWAIRIIDLSLPCYREEKAKFLLAMRKAVTTLTS